ncbi:MAG: SCO family protein [Sulfurimonas sp.]|uniref:SCO family protein n=1 Tax=Sulfurimonas sp. TaxID=2022749 RepID=UPI00260185D4|nr:SCO family protein [Sulfurimonas sp.]MDD2653362.1 SCO family protein [Sulfurimonas sp.]MDD3450668.1 SCO family protein [Sulfurimonas sp.]
MVIEKNVKADFIKSDKKFVLLFFGYFGCRDVCTPILEEMSKLYESKEFEELRESVDVIFVNLTPEVDSFQPDLFAKYFNNAFKGVYLSKGELFSMDRNFELYFARSLSDDTELNHTDNIYLIKNNQNSKVLKSIYSTHPIQRKKLIDDIISLKGTSKNSSHLQR